MTTSPWRFAYADETRRIIDRVATCEEWWACSSGFADLPDVERFVQIFMADQQAQATAMIRNEIDQTHDIRVDLIEQILEQNPDATTWQVWKIAPNGTASVDAVEVRPKPSYVKVLKVPSVAVAEAS